MNAISCGRRDAGACMPADMDSSQAPPQAGRPSGATHADEAHRTPRKKKREPGDLEQPSAGRTTPLGRKVESPSGVKPGGPSGQRDQAQHQKQHTNK